MTQLLNMVSDIRIGGPLLHGGLFNYGATLNKRELVSINMCSWLKKGTDGDFATCYQALLLRYSDMFRDV